MSEALVLTDRNWTVLALSSVNGSTKAVHTSHRLTLGPRGLKRYHTSIYIICCDMPQEWYLCDKIISVGTKLWILPPNVVGLCNLLFRLRPSRVSSSCTWLQLVVMFFKLKRPRPKGTRCCRKYQRCMYKL
jgi:hypothetical protein